MKENKMPVAVQAQIDRLLKAAGSGEADLYAGKRHSTRVADEIYLEVTLDPSKASAAWGVYMHNISGGGFAVWSKKEVPLRSTLYVRECREEGPGPWLRARITHSTRGLRGFLIGAAFETDSS